MSKEDRQDHQLDAERAVLGSILIDPNVVQSVMATVKDEDFRHPSNKLIFQAARALFRAGEPVDAFTIRNRVGEQYSKFLADLFEFTPTSANWDVYAQIMHEQATVQRARDVGQQLLEAVTLEDCRPLGAELDQLLSGGRKLDAWTMREMLDDFYASQDPDKPAPEYIRLGFEEIDRGTFIQGGDVVVLGGYPNDGKTALALRLAYSMAGSHKVGFFSLETNREKLRDRTISHVAQVPLGSIKQRTLTDDDWKAVAEKSADMAKRNLTVLRASGMTATEIQSVSMAYGFDVIFLDYVQLVTPEVDRRAPRSEQMADVSRTLHTFAQQSGTLVVELAQLTRQERGAWREPDMHDLKESGQFEQDADVILLIYRPNPKDEQSDQEHNRVLRIAKNKEGRQGRFPLFFDGDRQTFSMVTPDAGRDVMRKMTAAGKKARQSPRQVSFWADGSDFQEVPADKDNPFTQEVKHDEA